MTRARAAGEPVVVPRDRPLRAYYLATPLFAALDLGLSAPIRAVGLESPGARLAYYAASFGIGLLITVRPALAPGLAIGESAINLTLLMASVLVPMWSLGETLDTGATADLPWRVLNLALGGSVLVYSFYRNQARIRPAR